MSGMLSAALSAPAPEPVKSPSNGLPVAGVDSCVAAPSFPAHPDADKKLASTKHVSAADEMIVFFMAATTLTTYRNALRPGPVVTLTLIGTCTATAVTAEAHNGRRREPRFLSRLALSSSTGSAAAGASPSLPRLVSSIARRSPVRRE